MPFFTMYFGPIFNLQNHQWINPIALRKAKLYTILAFLSAIGLRRCVFETDLTKASNNADTDADASLELLYGQAKITQILTRLVVSQSVSHNGRRHAIA